MGGGDSHETRSRCAVRNEQNQREHNEDSFLITELLPTFDGPPLTILAVADGMGGHSHGEEVSSEALKKFGLSLFENLVLEQSLNRLNRSFATDMATLSQTLMSALKQVNHHVLRMVQNNGWTKAGSTIVAAAILGTEAVAMNLGDSSLFHYRAADQHLLKITQDHSMAGVLLRAGRITPEMARVHEGADQLAFYLGAKELPTVEPVYKFEVGAADLLLLCSDGISGSLSDEQIAHILKHGDDDLESIADRLVQESLAAGETDNQTLILWQQRDL